MIPVHTVAGAGHGIANQSLLKGRFFDTGCEPFLWCKRRTTDFVCHQFYAAEQASPTNVSHIGMLAKLVFQCLIKTLTHPVNTGNQIARENRLENGTPGCRCHRMPQISVSMLEKP